MISQSGPGATVLTSFEAAMQHLKATVDTHLPKSDSDPRPAFAAAQEALRRLQSVAADKDQNVFKDLFETYSVSIPTDAGDGGPIDLYDPTFWTAAFPYHFSHGDGVESLAKRPTRGLTESGRKQFSCAMTLMSSRVIWDLSLASSLGSFAARVSFLPLQRVPGE